MQKVQIGQNLNGSGKPVCAEDLNVFNLTRVTRGLLEEMTIFFDKPKIPALIEQEALRATSREQ
ncbi:hypothetical protein ABH15_12355 [Methanoculleus taiwanensis]|uniref:Uncharacterized protein n=1 Tax=Methanoculleus taiwanensis TaxID=1550565 RepID=A0A498GXI6_9EURY|nr:hypothetical protein [Methanoculleus taiwanensis]RXE55501.1 hypothetical protein ABH15_12355 [Methanoculleus taiwanensis]